jgi:hypothetical protein
VCSIVSLSFCSPHLEPGAHSLQPSLLRAQLLTLRASSLHLTPHLRRPWEAPVEYVFNWLEGQLRTRLPLITNTADLVREVQNVLANPPNINNFFAHCRY